MAKGFFRENWFFRALGTFFTDIHMEAQEWGKVILYILSPSIIIHCIYVAFKFLEWYELELNRIPLTNFELIDHTYIYYLVASILITFFIVYKYFFKFFDYMKSEQKRLVSDEWVDGSKLVCVDDFNKQFEQYDDFIEIKIIEEKCEQQF
ncbi:MAG: hypothetical protein PHZ10_07730 [Aliarcobacter cryaerophilus]|nr:hypothetical protein [Aliarcobacter cryaerophilus]